MKHQIRALKISLVERLTFIEDQIITARNKNQSHTSVSKSNLTDPSHQSLVIDLFKKSNNRTGKSSGGQKPYHAMLNKSKLNNEQSMRTSNQSYGTH